MKNFLLVVGVALSFLAIGECHVHCENDGDCEMLGDEVICVKTSCEVGICGCPRGRSMRYRGYPPHRYKCVPHRRVGEKCSFDGMMGECFAPNSFCDMDDKRCKCMSGYYKAQEGKLCVNTRLAGETCQPFTSYNPASRCESSSSCQMSYGSHLHSVIEQGVGQCVCDQDETLDFRLLHGEDSYWTIPNCRRKKIGEYCLRNDDCPDSGGSGASSGGSCVNNKCKCVSTKVPNYEMTVCKEGLGKNAICKPFITTPTNNIGKHCDGTKGLVCGDICDPPVYSSAATNLNYHRCVCAPQYTTSGSNCAQIKEGHSCYGDQNCKGIGSLARCIDGKCESGGVQVVAGTLMTLVLALMAYITI